MKKYIIFTFALAVMSLTALATGIILLVLNHIMLGLLALLGSMLYGYVTYNHIEDTIEISNENPEFFD